MTAAAEPVGGLAPGGGEPPRELIGEPVVLRDLRLELVDAVGVAVELEQPAAPGVGVREHRVEVGPVPALQHRELVDPLLHDLEPPGRVGIEGGEVGGAARRMRRRRATRRSPRSRRSSPSAGSSGGAALERAARLDEQGERVERTDVLGGQGLVGGRSRDTQLVLRAEPLGEGGELGVLAGLRGDALDLGEGRPQVPRLRCAGVAVAGEVLELRPVRLPAPPHLPVVGEQAGHRRTGEAVEHLPLRGRRLQPQLLRLAVHGDELVAEVLQHPDGNGAARDRHAAAALGSHGAADEQLGPAVADRLELAARLADAVGDGPAVGHEPAGLGDRVAGPAPQHAGVRPSTEQQPEGGDDHRLARAGLAGEGGEAGAERQGRLLDHADPPDRDLLDHAAGLTKRGRAIPRPGGRTSARDDR